MVHASQYNQLRTSNGQEDMEGHVSDETYTDAIVSAKYGRYYPGKIVDADNVPDSSGKKWPTTAEKYIIYWYEENNYCAI